MFHRLRPLLDFRTQKLTEISKDVIQQKGIPYDHVAIDIGQFCGFALRVCRDLSGIERDAEVSNYLSRNVVGMILKKIHVKKSLSIFFDGSDPLWKLRRSRKFVSKKNEGRFLRSAGSPMPFTAEDRIHKYLLEGPGVGGGGAGSLPLLSPNVEVMISGAGTPGPAEAKMSQFLLDKCAGGGSNIRGDSFCLIGGQELALSAWAMSPLYNITSMYIEKHDYKTTSLTELSEFFGVGELYRSGKNIMFSHIRLDTSFLMLLGDGLSVVDCPSIPNVHYKDLLDAYFYLLPKQPPLSAGPPGSPSFSAGTSVDGEPSTYLVMDDPVTGELCINVKFLLEIVASVLYKLPVTNSAPNTTTTTVPPSPAAAAAAASGAMSFTSASISVALSKVVPKVDTVTADSLEILLQTINMISNGGIKNYEFASREPLVAQLTAWKPELFVAHLLWLLKPTSGLSAGTKPTPKGAAPADPTTLWAASPSPVSLFPGTSNVVVRASVNTTFALTPAEYLLVCSNEATQINQTLPAFTGGHSLPQGMAEALCAVEEVKECATKAKAVLGVMSSMASGLDPALVPSTVPAMPVPAKKAAEGDDEVDPTAGMIAIPHRGLLHNPTHLWLRKAGEKGPPVGWLYQSVNLGLQSNQLKTRMLMNKESTITGVVVAETRKKKNALVGYEALSQTWAERDTSNLGNATIPKGVGSTLTLVTWNVQFDRYSNCKTPLGKPGIDWCSRTRYVALSKVLESTGADIIAMQECEPTWWDYLSRQPWVQQQYFFSTPMKGEAMTPWGQMMLVKKTLPVIAMGASSVPGYTGHVSIMPSCTVQLQSTAGPSEVPNAVSSTGGMMTSSMAGSAPLKQDSVMVNSLHLLAPFTQSNVNVRVTQLDVLMKRLSPKLIGNDVVCMGDFNDYPSNFFVMPPVMGAFRDAWVEVHGTQDEDAGYTINGRKSKYTSLIIEPEFFGRADRVLCKSAKLKCTGASLIGTKSVREELNIMTCPDYLFPSDHFGLKAVFTVL